MGRADPRVREQEFGNLQGDEFRSFRAEQLAVGRFWYHARAVLRSAACSTLVI